MHKDKVKSELERVIRRCLQAISIGSFLHHSDLASQLGLHPTDLQALHHLGGVETGMAAGDLMRALDLTSGATTALINRLEARNYVVRKHSNSDRRKVLVCLNPDGLSDLKRKYTAMDSKIQSSLEGRSIAELRAIASFLGDIADKSGA